MLTFAVQLRNRRKWATPSESEIPVQSYAGVDTFSVSCWVQFKSGEQFVFPHEHFIESVREEQTRLREARTGGTGLIEVLGQRVSVNRTGTAKGGETGKAPYYPYVVTWRGIRFEFQQFAEATKTVPNVNVYVSSTPLIAKGGDWAAVWDEARYFLESVLLGQVTQTKVGRLDVFVDMPGHTVQDYVDRYQRGQFVRRARCLELIATEGEVEAAVVQSYIDAAKRELETRLLYKGRQASGMYIGKSGVVCRIYDKLLEMESKEDLTKWESMKAAFWGGGVPDELTRIEFQLRTRQLREAGIADVASLRSELRNLSGWLCNAWLTIREQGFCRKYARDAEYDPHWRAVVDTVSSRFGGGWNRLARIVPGVADRTRLLDQAIGCLASYLAKGDFPGGEGELLELLDEAVIYAINRKGLKTLFGIIKDKVLDHHARVTSCFTDLQRGDQSREAPRADPTNGVRFADYSSAPGGVDGYGSNAVCRPDARLALAADDLDPAYFPPEQWEKWQRNYRNN